MYIICTIWQLSFILLCVLELLQITVYVILNTLLYSFHFHMRYTHSFVASFTTLFNAFPIIIILHFVVKKSFRVFAISINTLIIKHFVSWNMEPME